MRARAVSVVLAAALALAAAPAAQGGDPFTDYTANGAIEPCDYSVAELEVARDTITPNIRSYASDYPKALNQALRARKRDNCGTGGAGAPRKPFPAETATPVPATPTVTVAPAPAVAAAPTPAAPRPADDDGPDLSGALVVLAVAAGLLVLGLLLALALSRFGREEGRLAPANQAWQEARWRVGGVWADFRDWLSLGR